MEECVFPHFMCCYHVNTCCFFETVIFFKIVPKCSYYFEAQTRRLEKERKTEEDKTKRKNKIEKPPSQRWGSYAEELVPLLLVGRRPETDSGWLGGDAGEYRGKTGENCEAGVLSTCEPGEMAEPAVLAWLPNIRRNAGELRAAYPYLGGEQRG